MPKKEIDPMVTVPLSEILKEIESEKNWCKHQWVIYTQEVKDLLEHVGDDVPMYSVVITTSVICPNCMLVKGLQNENPIP